MNERDLAAELRRIADWIEDRNQSNTQITRVHTVPANTRVIMADINGVPFFDYSNRTNHSVEYQYQVPVGCRQWGISEKVIVS